MRIISGKYKGRRFDPPKNFKARPTTDFAKENLFNILNNEIDWESISALDLFGGTGSISFELISRGCKDVACIEKSPVHFDFIDKTREKLGIDKMILLRMDVFRFLENNREQFDLIFADPPYELTDFKKVPELVLGNKMIKEDGIFILEHSKNYDFSDFPLFSERRVYGSVNFSIFRNKKME